MNKQRIGFFLMVLSAVGLASATILIKLIHVHTDLPASQVAVWRFTIAAPLMWLLLLIKKPAAGWVPDRPWSFLGLGLVFTVSSFSAIFALERLPPSLYVILIYLYPSLVVLYALAAGKRVPRLYWLGLPLTLAGLVLTVYQFGESLVVDGVGLLIALLNAFAMASYLILSEKVFSGSRSRRLGTTWMATGAMIAGGLTALMLGLSTPDHLTGWLLVFALGIFGTLVPLMAMNAGLQMIGAARGSLINTLQPVVAVLFATLFLGDRLQLQQWIGGILVITAVILLQRSPDRRTEKKDKQTDD
jgi:drug/metabolite transporter (DMT)-like permease